MESSSTADQPMDLPQVLPGDITLQREMLQSLQLQSLILERMDEGVSVSDENGFITLTNPAEDKMFGYATGELLGKHVTIQNAYAPEENERIVGTVIEELKTKGSWSGEWYNRKKDGTSFYTYSFITSVSIDGKTMFVCVQRDITEEKKYTDILKQSEERFEGAVAAVQGVLWTNNAQGEMIGEQPGWASLTGQSYEEYQGSGWSKAVHPEDAQPTIDAWNLAVLEQKTFVFEHRIRMKDGKWRLFSIRAIPLFNSDGSIREWVGVHTDITGQRQTEESLKESEERFRSLADQSPMIVYIVEPNAEATMSYFNKTWLNYTGQTFEEALGRAWDGIVHRDDLQGVLDIYVPAFQARISYTLPAIRLKRHDNEYRWHIFKGNPRYLPNGEFIGFVGVGFDIHEQKLAEEKLAYRTALLEAHNQANVDGVLLVDAKGKIISYNQRFIEIWNMPQEIVNAKDDEAALAFAMTQLVHPHQFIDKVKYLYEHPTETSLDELEYKDGKIIERNGYPVVGEDGSYYAWSWTFKDVTRQRQIEKKIKESEERFRTLAETLPQLVWITDAKGQQEYASSRWKEYTGLEPTGAESWQQMVHPDDMPVITKAWMDSINNGGIYRSEARLKNKEGISLAFCTGRSHTE